MKKNILKLTLLGGAMICFGQSITGKYSESAIIAPDKIRNIMQNNVVITTDKNSSKKIWINNLIGNTTFYAIRNTVNDEKEIYNIPPQNIGNYIVNIGCIVFDKEEKQISIVLNNKSNCAGISQSDYGNVSLGKKEIKTGSTKIGFNDKISTRTGNIQINKKGININTKEALSGVQYVGTKI